MPSTPVYNYPFERYPTDQPGITLYGGTSGTEPILAEVIETETQRVDNDIAAVQDNVDVVDQSIGWKRLSEGTHAGAAFGVDVPAGAYSQLRLGMRGHLDGIGTVRLRINNDTTAGHRTAIRSVQHDGTVGSSAQSDEANQWICAHWASTGGNTCTVNMYFTDTTANVGYDSQGGRMSAGTGMWVSHGWGRINNARIVSGLSIRPFSDAANEFASLRWWLWGWPVLP